MPELTDTVTIRVAQLPPSGAAKSANPALLGFEPTPRSESNVIDA
jgi:hypothetical protein